MNALAHAELIQKVSLITIGVCSFYVAIALLTILSKNRRKLAKGVAHDLAGSHGRKPGAGRLSSVSGILHALFEPLVEFVMGCMNTLQPEKLADSVKSGEINCVRLIKFTFGIIVAMTVLLVSTGIENSQFNITGFQVVDDALFVVILLLYFGFITVIEYWGL